MTTTIDSKNLYYRNLNRRIRVAFLKGHKEIVLKNVLGQRYIGGGLNHKGRIVIEGTPGQDLGAFMNGPEIFVLGNAQDGVANTMNSGKIVVLGKAGEIPGYSMRGGRVFIRGDVEYRAGIHMKEYKEQIPVLVIGGTAKDYCGEYMAGGRIVVLNLKDHRPSPVGDFVGTGIHGGAIYIRGAVDPGQLGIGAVFGAVDGDDVRFLDQILKEFSRAMDMDLSGIDPRKDFLKITRKGHRPFGDLYTPAMNVKTGPPRHINLAPPCAHTCPTGIPTPAFFNLIKAGKEREAQLLMDEYTPFRMSVCGTVCPALCMTACNRNLIDGPVEIQKMAREHYPDFPPVQSKEKRKETISVIGAGPSGLSAAWQLSRRGYAVRVYDGEADLGGKVRRAIPRERLSDAVLERDMARIRTLPIDFLLGTQVDRKKFQRIREESDIVVVATGAQRTKRIPYAGGERILSGLQFLMDINDGKAQDLAGKSVVIIGAGNVGMDIACESWRLGAKRVAAVDIQKPLAFGKELDLAMSLGTELLWPRKVEWLDGKSIYFQGGERMDADIVFFSIGEVPDTSFLPESVFVNDRGYIVTTEKSFRTTDPKVFVAGDAVRPGLITDAVGSGRLSALEIHGILTGRPFQFPEKVPVPRNRINTAYFGAEGEGIDRCLSCGTCIFCDKCVELCPQNAISRNGEVFTIDMDRCTLCYTCVAVCPRGALQVDRILRNGEKKENHA